jgi:prepilin-type N-terminal cleavage/methylation domain-containing protein
MNVNNKRFPANTMTSQSGRKLGGFTLIELLIVIVVIAILATISIVVYRGIQNRAYDAVVESDLNNAIKLLEVARVELGHYPQDLSEFPTGFTFTKSVYVADSIENNIYYITDMINDTYALGVQSKSGNGFIVVNGVVEDRDYPRVWGATVANAIGVDWFDPDTVGYTGYDVTSSDGWRSDWAWTAP